MAQAVTASTPANLEETGTALLEVDGRHVGEVVSIPESKFAHKQWFGVQFARADVTRSAVRLLDDGEVWVPGGETNAEYSRSVSWENSVKSVPDRREASGWVR